VCIDHSLALATGQNRSYAGTAGQQHPSELQCLLPTALECVSKDAYTCPRDIYSACRCEQAAHLPVQLPEREQRWFVWAMQHLAPPERETNIIGFYCIERRFEVTPAPARSCGWSIAWTAVRQQHVLCEIDLDPQLSAPHGSGEGHYACLHLGRQADAGGHEVRMDTRGMVLSTRM
jgi:hypothetical protein